MEHTVVRNLEDGLDYASDWRAQIVQLYLADIVTAPNGPTRLARRWRKLTIPMCRLADASRTQVGAR